MYYINNKYLFSIYKKKKNHQERRCNKTGQRWLGESVCALSSYPVWDIGTNSRPFYGRNGSKISRYDNWWKFIDKIFSPIAGMNSVPGRKISKERERSGSMHHVGRQHGSFKKVTREIASIFASNCEKTRFYSWLTKEFERGNIEVSFLFHNLWIFLECCSSRL